MPRKIPTGLNTKPFCTCIVNGTWKSQDGWVEDRRSGLWVHPRCKKPSKMNYDRIHGNLPIIPENRPMEFMKGEVDIYKEEQRYVASKEINKELDWGDDLD